MNDFLKNVLSEALGGLLGDGARVAAPVLWNGLQSAVQRGIQQALPAAQDQYARNTATFAVALSAELTPGHAEPEALAAAEDAVARFADPDVAATLANAVHTAGRTSGEERHRVLAKLVAARLGATTDTARAVAGNLAVDTVQSLGREHLRLLGLLAALHGGIQLPGPGAAPTVDEVPTGDRPLGPLLTVPHSRGTALGDIWVGQVHAALDVYTPLPPSLSSAITLHLLGAACVALNGLAFVRSGDAQQHLEYLLLAEHEAQMRRADSAADDTVSVYNEACGILSHEIDHSEVLQGVSALLADGLAQLTPTPAGHMIGLAVHDASTGSTRLRDNEWAPDAPREFVKPTRARFVGEEFRTAVERIARDAAENAVRDARRRPARGDRTPR